MTAPGQESDWREVPGAPDIPEGSLRAVEVDGIGIVLARCGGRLFAMEDRCSHDDGPLGEGSLVKGEGPDASCEVVCPRHGARFDVRDGRVTRMPAVAPIRTASVREEDGTVRVDTGGL